MEDATQPSGRPEGSRRARSFVGWIVFLLFFAAVLYFGYRVWFFYDKIRRGELAELPQFESQFTLLTNKSAGSGDDYVERAVLENGDHPTLGAGADAKLTIVEFGDFGCPYSREAADVVRSLMAKYGDRVRFIYRYDPLDSIHPLATQAAVAAECAREQGKFWAYHDKLYSYQGAFSLADLTRYADQVGLEPKQFGYCIAGNRYQNAVMSDAQTAKEIGVRGTPTFYFNGQRVEGSIPADIFEKLVQELLK